MMHALAQFIMSSRLRALLVAFLGNLLPLISPATVALVTVRKGLNEGVLVLLWAVLPLVLMLYVSEVNPLLVWTSVASVLVVLLAALILRITASWQLTLLGLVLLSALSVAPMSAMNENVALLQATLMEKLEQMQRLPVEPESGQADQIKVDQAQVAVETGAEPELESLPLSQQFVLGLLAWVVAMGSVASLLLGRWWQALLYNPGGFATEFRALRLYPLMALTLVAGMASCYLFSTEYAAWGNLLGLPLLIAGLALVHHRLAVGKIGVHWLAIFYICFLLLPGPFSVMLLGLGLLDSMMDLRSLWARPAGDA